MEPHSIQEYIHVGAMNWYLVRLPDSVQVKTADDSIKDLQENIQKADLKVTYRAGHRLWEIQGELDKMNAWEEVSPSLISEIRKESEDLEKTLVAEAEGKNVFVVTEKRIDVEKLTNKPDTLLSSKVWISLPRVSAYDFANACKAIAFELPTAGAFHLLRCLEGTIGHYYLCVIKRNRLPTKSRMWGPMIKQLREKKKNHPPKDLIEALDRIRISFRNPTSHPDKMYDSDEVQDLFGLVVDSLNRIVKSKQWKEPDDSIRKLFVKSEKDRMGTT
jgi:hypothetical protein